MLLHQKYHHWDQKTQNHQETNCLSCLTFFCHWNLYFKCLIDDHILLSGTLVPLLFAWFTFELCFESLLNSLLCFKAKTEPQNAIILHFTFVEADTFLRMVDLGTFFNLYLSLKVSPMSLLMGVTTQNALSSCSGVRVKVRLLIFLRFSFSPIHKILLDPPWWSSFSTEGKCNCIFASKGLHLCGFL